MKVKDLIKELKQFDEDMTIIFSSDEELNCLRGGGEAVIDEELKVIYIYGFDGTELEYNLDTNKLEGLK